MKIGPVNRPEQTPELIQRQQIGHKNNDPQCKKEDRVEISDAGREKLKNLSDDFNRKVGNDNSVIEQISSKTARIRNKIEAGHYDLEIVDNIIAEKLADSMLDEFENNKSME